MKTCFMDPGIHNVSTSGVQGANNTVKLQFNTERSLTRFRKFTIQRAKSQNNLIKNPFLHVHAHTHNISTLVTSFVAFFSDRKKTFCETIEWVLLLLLVLLLNNVFLIITNFISEETLQK